MSNEAPTDALRLVPKASTGEMQAAGRDALEPFVGILKQPVEDQWHLARLVWSAMYAAAPASPLPEGGGQCSGISGEQSGWQDIGTAPKDGVWIQAWRTPPSFTGGRWEPLVYVRWDDEEGSWVWPCDMFEVFTVRGRELADMAIADGDYYSSPDFTHWMPLPAAPTGAK